MKPRIRAIIVGAGLMGRWHAFFAMRCGAQILAIVDHNEQAARRLQRHVTRGSRIFDSLADCLEECVCDAVHVCTHSDSHVPLCEAAISAGCHVLVEKPTAPSLVETMRIVALAAQSAVQCCAVHQFPWQRGFQEALRNTDRLGDLCQVNYRAYSAGGDGQTHDRRCQILHEILPHPFSLFRAVRRNCLTDGHWTVLRKTSDALMISGETDDVCFGVDISLVARPPRNELTIVWTQATGYIDLFHGYSTEERGGVGRAAKIARPFRSSASIMGGAAWNLARRAMRGQTAYPGLQELIRRFYDSFSSVDGAPVSAEEIVEVAQVMELVGQG